MLHVLTSQILTGLSAVRVSTEKFSSILSCGSLKILGWAAYHGWCARDNNWDVFWDFAVSQFWCLGILLSHNFGVSQFWCLTILVFHNFGLDFTLGMFIFVFFT